MEASLLTVPSLLHSLLVATGLSVETCTVVVLGITVFHALHIRKVNSNSAGNLNKLITSIILIIP